MMNQTEADATPAEKWLSELKSICNRLHTQYANLLQATSGTVTEDRGSDPRAGGGRMSSLSDPPPPPFAANVGLSDLTVQVSSENLCAAASEILTLTRTLRLSLLLMDKDTVEAEEQVQVEASVEKTKEALEKAVELEQKYLQHVQNSLKRPEPC